MDFLRFWHVSPGINLHDSLVIITSSVRVSPPGEHRMQQCRKLVEWANEVKSHCFPTAIIWLKCFRDRYHHRSSSLLSLLMHNLFVVSVGLYVSYITNIADWRRVSLRSIFSDKLKLLQVKNYVSFACLPKQARRIYYGLHWLDGWIVQWMKITTRLIRIWHTRRAIDVGCMESPEWFVPCERTERPPRETDAKSGWPALLGLADCLLNLSASFGRGCWNSYCCHAREDLTLATKTEAVV